VSSVRGGQWRVRVTWSAAAQSYFVEKSLVLDDRPPEGVKAATARK